MYHLLYLSTFIYSGLNKAINTKLSRYILLVRKESIWHMTLNIQNILPLIESSHVIVVICMCLASTMHNCSKRKDNIWSITKLLNNNNYNTFSKLIETSTVSGISGWIMLWGVPEKFSSKNIGTNHWAVCFSSITVCLSNPNNLQSTPNPTTIKVLNAEWVNTPTMHDDHSTHTLSTYLLPIQMYLSQNTWGSIAYYYLTFCRLYSSLKKCSSYNWILKMLGHYKEFLATISKMTTVSERI